jgi:hypothetical protein
MRKGLFFIIGGLLMLTSCVSKSGIRHLAEENLRESVYYPKQLKILAVSEPDSAYGVNYFNPKEVQGMLRIMKVVTDSIMKRTNGMTEFNPDDYYVISLADRQMRATNEIREMVFRQQRKGEWTGWKVKIDYEAIDHSGCKYRSERWFFTDKKGHHIIRTFDIPLP